VSGPAEGAGVSGPAEGAGVSGPAEVNLSGPAKGGGAGPPVAGAGVTGPAEVRRRGRRGGRRGGDSGTREAILAAARTRFGDYGYDGATIRGIAADAGVDAALVHHFFGTKERLFVAAMRLPIDPSELVAAALAPDRREPGRSLGEHLLLTVLRAWDVPDMRATFLGLLRSAVTSEQAAGMLREFATEAILGRIAGAAAPGPSGTDQRFRAALVASQVLGLALTRYVLALDPLVQAGTGDLAAAIGPTLERYLTGEIRKTAPSANVVDTGRP
jgi:AcrR family transcriptional regulator